MDNAGSFLLERYFLQIIQSYDYLNCSRNLTSFSYNSRMSSSPYISAHSRSSPSPKAKPVNSSGSIPTARSTLGWTIPEPPISIQPEPLQTRPPRPLHLKHGYSISAPGSTS